VQLPSVLDTDPLSAPPSAYRRVFPALAEELDGRGLHTVRDLLLHRPSRYEDRRERHNIGELKPGMRALLVAEVRRVRKGRPRRGGRTLMCDLIDGTGTLPVVFFHARPWHHRELTGGKRYAFTGAVREGKPRGLVLFNPEYESLEEGLELGTEREPAITPVHAGNFVPLYPGTRHPRALRALVSTVLEKVTDLPETLSADLREGLGLLALPQALRELHFPDPEADPEQLERADTPAHRRLAFDEFFSVSLDLARRRLGLRKLGGHPLRSEPERVERALSALPFAPTAAQRRACLEIAADLREPHPMQRLLEGDVGSGKTAVAAVAMRLAVESGAQAALMAPTELLAEQHHRSLSALLAGHGPEAGIEVHLVTATSGGSNAEGALAAAHGRPCVLVGTQALIQGELRLPKLALAVVDEQHRFGVQDRLRLQAKGRCPHVLLMSATPIPRTLSLAVHGDLDLSVLDELPPGRKPVTTKVLQGKARLLAVDALKREVSRGKQAFVVYPLIDESEKVPLQDATQGAEKLRQALPGTRIALVHGRLRSAEREEQMQAFRRGEIDVLVATTVVEVGVDCPNATLMIVAQAERFGLAQLHQLRGRVGRGTSDSECYLLAEGPLTAPAKKRLKALEKLHDGFRLAEIDLQIRGAGEVLGTRQSGLADFRIADPFKHPEILARARAEAFALIERDPELASEESRTLVHGLQRLFGERRSLGTVG
jgi:ATP-dependent DNA helicase RecG